MRLIICMMIAALLGSGCSKPSKKEEASENSESKVKEMLTTFYTDYITLNSNLELKTLAEKSDSINKKYFSSKLCNYLKHVNDNGLELDYDPILSGQMVDTRMLEHLTIRKDDKEDNVYHASYTYGSDTPITIKLFLIKENDSYKIDRVFSGGNLFPPESK